MTKDNMVIDNGIAEANEVLAFVGTLTPGERQNFLMFLQGAKLARVLTGVSKEEKPTTV